VLTLTTTTCIASGTEKRHVDHERYREVLDRDGRQPPLELEER